MQKIITYFDEPGKINTNQCLDIVDKSIDEFSYKHVVVASTNGDTGILFAERLKDKNINLALGGD